jgi:hypothetical protein
VRLPAQTVAEQLEKVIPKGFVTRVVKIYLKYWQSSDSTLVNPTTGNIALASNADLDAR